VLSFSQPRHVNFEVVLNLFGLISSHILSSGLGMPEYIKKFVHSRGIEQSEYSTIEEVVEVADVLYVTRYRLNSLIIKSSREKAKREHFHLCWLFHVHSF
jgi:hypothetical protein